MQTVSDPHHAGVRQFLEMQRQTLLERLERIEHDRSHRAAPLEADFSEQAVQRENDEVLDGLAVSVRDQLDQIQAALRRVQDGDYAWCERCGKEIEAARHRALPSATLCIACSQPQG